MVTPLWLPTSPTLTGRIRHRLGWRGRLVLQVEEEWFMRQGIAAPDKSKRHTRWRDAILADMDGRFLMVRREAGVELGPFTKFAL